MGMFNAQDWKGKEWLIFLCITFSLLAATYWGIHLCSHGREYVTLGTKEMQNISNLFDGYSDTASTDNALYAIRAERNSTLETYLTVEVHNKLDSAKLREQQAVLLHLNNKDASAYIRDAKFMAYSYFWLTGPRAYWEVIFWSLFGVFTSLIYYVSLANRNTLSNDSGDVGIYDASEIPSQVGKMFYAPMCTLVLVLGYSLFSKEEHMIDINAGKGLILFSFICGFFSGRVMKFLDKLKDLLLPLGGSTAGGATPAPTPATGGGNAGGGGTVSVQLQLAPSLAQSAEGPDIIEGGFNSATVTLTDATGNVTTLTDPADDQSDLFTAANVTAGTYTLSAAMNYTSGTTIMNFSATQSVTVAAGENSFTIQLETNGDEG